MENEDAKLVYSVPELSRALGLSLSNTYDLVACGVIPSVRIRGRVLIPKKTVNDLLEKQAVTTA